MAKRIVKTPSAQDEMELLKARMAELNKALFEEKRIDTWTNSKNGKKWLVFKFTKESGAKRDLLLTKQMYQEIKDHLSKIEIELNAQNVTWN